MRPRPVAIAAAVLLLASSLAPGAQVAELGPFDLIVRGGRVIDGSGNPWFHADVGVSGDRIVAIGDLAGRASARQIDAAGRIVAPGFIDTHSHTAGGLVSEDRREARPLLAQGITMVVVNADGNGPVDLGAQRIALGAHGLGVNVGLLVPHGAVRAAVVGYDDRMATEPEMERMRGLVRAGMRAGALGLSSGTFYAPASFAPPEELAMLAAVAAESDGVYASHIRDESDYTVGVAAAVAEVIAVARSARLPVVVSHIKVLGPPVWGRSPEIIELIEAARAEGLEVYADQYPYAASATGLDVALLPRWAQQGGRDAFRARLADAPTRSRIVAAATANLERRGGPDRIRFRYYEPDPSVEGRTLTEVAALHGRDAVDAALGLMAEGSAGIVSFNMTEADVRAFMARPWTMTASDGSYPPWGRGVPHPRSLGTFPRRIRAYVIEDPVTSLENAVRSMTALPAQAYRIRNRGRLAEGAYADLVVFDPERLIDKATYDAPWQLSEGMDFVVVNGVEAVRDREPTGARAGKVVGRHDR